MIVALTGSGTAAKGAVLEVTFMAFGWLMMTRALTNDLPAQVPMASIRFRGRGNEREHKFCRSFYKPSNP
jgi:hypothetical protein